MEAPDALASKLPWSLKKCFFLTCQSPCRDIPAPDRLQVRPLPGLTVTAVDGWWKLVTYTHGVTSLTYNTVSVYENYIDDKLPKRRQLLRGKRAKRKKIRPVGSAADSVAQRTEMSEAGQMWCGKLA